MNPGLPDERALVATSISQGGAPHAKSAGCMNWSCPASTDRSAVVIGAGVRRYLRNIASAVALE
jgi:hypothetical protein